jgi:hypothetical protein
LNNSSFKRGEWINKVRNKAIQCAIIVISMKIETNGYLNNLEIKIGNENLLKRHISNND